MLDKLSKLTSWRKKLAPPAVLVVYNDVNLVSIVEFAFDLYILLLTEFPNDGKALIIFDAC